METWTLDDATQWIIQHCVEDERGHPSSVGLHIQPSDVDEDHDKWKLICAAMEILRKDGTITADPTSFMHVEYPPVGFWQHVKLSQAAYVATLKVSSKEESPPIGFKTS